MATELSLDPDECLQTDVQSETAATIIEETATNGENENSSGTTILSLLDEVCELTKNGYKKCEEAQNLLENVFTKLGEIRDIFLKLEETSRPKIVDEVAERPQLFHTLVTFMAQVYKGMYRPTR